MKKILIAVEIVLIVAIGGFLLFIYSGWYNIAATAGHYDIVRWVLETTMEHSVRRHARGIEAPSLETRDLPQAFTHYDRMCTLCHGAPGMEPSEIGKGIVPDPPDLAKAVQEWTPVELFWIVKNGIKMSGMPAFGPTHKDEDIWNLIAFLRQLPRLTPVDYRSLSERMRQDSPAHPSNPDGHGHDPQRQETVPDNEGLQPESLQEEIETASSRKEEGKMPGRTVAMTLYSQPAPTSRAIRVNMFRLRETRERRYRRLRLPHEPPCRRSAFK